MDLENVDIITVLGAGNMGHGIAEVAALAGYEVRLRDINEEFVQNGYDQIEWSLNKLAEKEQLTEADAEAALDRITPLVDFADAAEDTDVVIEAVPEQWEIKKDAYGDVATHAPDNAIIASNTSSLSITELAEASDRPEQFCGMHFFNPPVRMQLVEVISGEQTSQETLDLIEGLAESLGKTPVRVRKDVPGFIVNRILVPLLNEAAWIVESEDATIAEVDSTTKYEMGLPMGAFELADQVGIDVAYHVLEYMEDVLGAAYEPCPLLEEKVEADELGKKTDQGFYDYQDGGIDIPTDAGTEEIRDRLLAIMANEVGHLVANDVADVPAIDRAVMLGAGFPDGPAKLADEVGVDSLVQTLDHFQEQTGAERYDASPYLRELAAEDEGFYEAEEEGPVLSFDTLRIEHEGRVGHIILDRPHRMNTVSHEMLTEFEAAVDYFADDEETRALLITGAGERAFSAGADVQSMAAGGTDPQRAVELSRKGQSTFGKLRDIDIPVVAGIDGYCLGGGMELATCADLRIASQRSEFGQPEHNLGLLPGWGGTQRLQRIVGEGRAKEIIFTGGRYEAEEMADYGFVNELTGNENLEEQALDLASDLAAGPPIAQRYTKRAMHKGQEHPEAGLEIEAQAFGHVMQTEDMMTGVAAFMSDEEPEFEGK